MVAARFEFLQPSAVYMDLNRVMVASQARLLLVWWLRMESLAQWLRT